jgi:diguanylate cyclase (GGDEF)-like protein
MMLLRAFRTFVIVLMLVGQAQAGTMASDAIELQRFVQKSPRQAAADAQLMLQQGKIRKDRALQLKALRILANAHTLLGNTFVIGEDIAWGERLARELNNPQAWVEFVIANADDAQLAGQFALADRRYGEALTMAQRSQLPLGIAMSYAAMVNAYVDRGLRNNVVIYATKAYDLFEGQGDLRGMAQMLAALGIHSNDPARTVEYLERALDLSDPSVYRWDAAVMSYELGAALYRNKDYSKARLQLQKALAGAAQLGAPVNVAYAQYYLGRVELAERHFNEAIAYWDKAVPVFSQNNDWPALFDTQRFRADALSALRLKAESAAALTEAQAAANAVRALESKGKSVPRNSRLQAPFNEYQSAYQDMVGTPAQARRGDASGYASASVAEARFDAKLRETENALLREQQKRAELERVTLVLALLGSVSILVLAVLLLIRQVRQKQRFANLAMRDELTGLRNRRSILEFARVQFGMRMTLGTRLFVALLDLDHFKRVNDEYGHDVGDAVLIGFANACQRHLRSNHVFGRFGGEEFLLIMPDTREDQVFDVFERLREIVGELTVSGLPESHRLSFSMGSAEVKVETASLEALIKEADLALYRAKEKGRDRCEIHQGALQASYDASVLRARPYQQAPMAYERAARLQTVTPAKIASVAPVER